MLDIRLWPLFIINEDEFNKAKSVYEKVLKGCGFKSNLKFASIQTKPSRNRKKEVVWFNPPFNTEVKTNICKVFMKLVRKYFYKWHRCNKIFNTNTIELGYSCTPNVKDCYCRNKDNWPLDGKCLVECIFYEATVSTANQTNTFFGSAEADFKGRYDKDINTALSCQNRFGH